LAENAGVPRSQFLVYRDETGATKIDVRLEDETVWLTQHGLAELFQTALSNINEHISNIYEEGELESDKTQRHFVIERQEGTRTVHRPILHYNLDMIISVGYRVKSGIATRFRIWATQQLRELIIKGFVMDDERLKNPDLPFDYFDELLDRIRDIRASEKRFYQKVRDIFALAIDYDKDAPEARTFFQTVQNKMLYAVTGHTAAEITAGRADHRKPNMGLTSWKGGRVRKGDVTVSKNYLNEREIDELNRIVVMYLDFAEDRAKRRIPMHMKEWMERLDAFLRFNEREVLDNLGTVSAAVAEATAIREYELFDANRSRQEAIAADEADMKELEEYIDRLQREAKE
jgi:hypothetical protein